MEFPIPVPPSRKLSGEQGWGEVRVRLTNTGKRFNREWIFRHFNAELVSGKSYAITGANGSGKSTLLQVIAGSLTYNEGNIQYAVGNVQYPDDEQFKHISIAAPYLELIEEMSANEILSFHRSFKSLLMDNEEILAWVQLQETAKKQIRYYSSGMKQRLKLAMAFFSATPVLLLDEPTTNLDANGIALYHQLIGEFTKDRLVIISSNDRQEYDFCDEMIAMENYK